METANNRQYNLDILKALAIIGMVICHPVLRLGSYIPGHENEFLYFLGDYILGDYFFVAHAFMFAMGVGMIYTRKSSPSDLLHRGIKLYLLGYVLNFFRYGMYFLTLDLIKGEIIKETWPSIFEQDILQFAGLAFILTAIFKKLRLTEVRIFIISIILSAIGSFIYHLNTGNYLFDFLIGHFVNTKVMSCFTIFNWYICVAFGLLIGSVLYNMQEKDQFYKKMFFISGSIMAIYIILTAIFGNHFLSAGRNYYVASTPDMMGLLSIDFFCLSAFHFILQKIDVSRFKIFIEMSKNTTVIYFTHWIILGPIDAILCFALGYVFTYAQIYLFALVLLVVSVIIARLWTNRKFCINLKSLNLLVF